MLSNIKEKREDTGMFLRTLNKQLEKIKIPDINLHYENLEIPVIKVTNLTLDVTEGILEASSIGMPRIDQNGDQLDLTCTIGLWFQYKNWNEKFEAAYDKDNSGSEDNNHGSAFFALNHIPADIRINTADNSSEISIPDYRLYISYQIPDEALINSRHYCTHGNILDELVKTLESINLEHILRNAITNM